MDTLFNIATKIATPLSLAGFATCAFFLIIKKLIEGNKIPQVGKGHGYKIIILIIKCLFVLSLVATIMGIIAFTIVSIYKRPTSGGNDSGSNTQSNAVPASAYVTNKIINNVYLRSPDSISYYTGYTLNGIPEGKGQLVVRAKNNDVQLTYEGDWSFGNFDGNGKLIYYNRDDYPSVGDTLNGTFSSGEFASGKGVVHYSTYHMVSITASP